MKNKYHDLIEQTFDWPQEEFAVEDGQLNFHGVDLMDVIDKYGTPLKFTYLPKIDENIQKVKFWFAEAKRKLNYTGDYHYCYVTKSNHFRYTLERVVGQKAHLETSSSNDIEIIRSLHRDGLLDPNLQIICNGFKQEQYMKNIAHLIGDGFDVIPVLDNTFEIGTFQENITKPCNIGIRVASEEEPKFEFYTSRLGIRYKEITKFYQNNIHNSPNLKLKMIHFFVNTGIRDSAYYWNELSKCLSIYIEIRKICPTLDSLNIGGGFPIKNSLAFEFDYQYMIEEILQQIKITCEEAGVPLPHIYTEFGSYTVGESGGALYKVLYQKKQNDREKWNMIDSSFMTTLPDTWAINKRFIMLPINNWDDTYERVFLGGLTCDSDDYYNSEQHLNAIYMPVYQRNKEQYLGFFNTGAYQESLSGYGGIHHCLIPQPKHVLIDRDENGKVTTSLFADEQTSEDMLSILGYK